MIGALTGAAGRGVAVRLAYNLDHPEATPVPPPPQTNPDLVESLPFPTVAIPGVPDLMHHKYVVRDGHAVWTGSTNWTADSWTREENVIATVESPELALHYLQNFEELWAQKRVQRTGRVDTAPIAVAGLPVRAWFCPRRGEKLAHRIAKAIGTATRRIRIASPVISSAPILATLAQVASADGRETLIWALEAEVVEAIQGLRENKAFLPGIVLNPGIRATTDFAGGSAGTTRSMTTA